MARNSITQDESLKEKSNIEILSRLMKYLKPFKFKVFIVVLMMIFVKVCSLLNPYLLQISIDKYIAASNAAGLLKVSALIAFINITAMFISKKRITIMASITNQILVDIRDELYSHIQTLSFAFFDSRPVGKILARVIGDVDSLQEFFSNVVTTFVPEILTLVIVTVMMFSMNYKLALASIIVLPILFAAMFVMELVSRVRWQAYRKKRSNFNAYTHEDFSGIKVIQSYARENDTSNKFVELVKDMMNHFVHAVKINDLFWPIVETSSGIGTIIVYFYSVRLKSGGQISIGTIIAFTWYVSMFWRPIINLSEFYSTVITNLASAERIFEIMDEKADIVNSPNASKMPEIKGCVEFKNVTFQYEEGEDVLHNVSFKVEPGESVALVGPTGAGKTTIVNLISRFYDATSGQVLIDGKDVKSVELESLRSQMGIMLQDTFLFSSTIKENIRYGKLDATDEEIIAAAKAVNAHDFIMQLENGYDTKVRERGSRLSVGQRQLISFARALLANPRILILDEATSNIDTYTEKLVQDGIAKLLKGRTSFVIAHRLSTIRDCDKIMVIKDGVIKECGKHVQLLKNKGLYYNLYMSQYKFLKEGA